MTEFALEPLYGSIWVLLIAAAAIIGVISLVTPPTDNPARRKWLVALRSLAGIVLLIAAMRPAIIRTDNRPAPAKLVVTIDQSKSMTLPDGDGADRWQTQREALAKLLAGIATLDDSLDVQLLAYDDQSVDLGEATEQVGIARLPEKIADQIPIGNATDLGRALESAVESAAGRPLAGVVMMGDGTQTAVGTPGDGTAQPNVAGSRRGAEILNALGVPLWMVPIGPPGGQGSTRDVGVSGLPDSYELFAGNEFDVSFTVQASGLANVQLPISIAWIDEQGNKTVARTRQIDPRGASETNAMSVTMPAPQPGIYRLEVSVPAQNGEWVTSNNIQTAFVDVRDGGGRILILEGPGRPEQTFLRRSMREFNDLELQYAPISGNQQWPVSLESALAPGRFDVFVIGDLDASAIGTAQLSILAKRISEGAGLIMMGGFQTYGVGGYAETGLADVLPIKMSASMRRQPTRGVMTAAELNARQASQLPGPIRPRVARNHPIVDLGASESGSVWQELPELPGANRFAGTKVAAGIQVLLQTEDQNPLLVIGSYGKGRVATLAIDETYRWWRAGKRGPHKRFWRQLILWAMAREETSGDRVIAELDLRRFAPEVRPTFTARLQTLASEQMDVSLAAVVLDSNGQEAALDVMASQGNASSGSGPSIGGRLPELPAGFYELVVRASSVNAGAEDIEPARVAFQVTETSRELERPMADPVYMEQLANLTADHGGGAFEPTSIDELIDRIASKRKGAETPVIDKARLGDGPLSGWIVFVLFAGPLSAEWFLRRRWGLV